MRVLHVDLHETWGGGQNQALLLARGLAARGHENWIATPPGSELGERARAAGVGVVDLPRRAELDPRGGWALAGLVRRLSPDVIHAHDAHAAAHAAFGRRLAGGRAALVVHRRMDRPLGKNPVSRWKWAGAPDRVIAIGQRVRGALQAGGVAAERIATIPDGIEPPAAATEPALRPRIGAAGDAPVVLTIAALNRSKDHATLIAAAARLQPREPATRWVVCGDGVELEARRAEVTRLGLADRVHYPGFVPEARAWLDEADAFALPTRSEGLGTSLLDAMAAGVPVVASAAGGVVEIVADGETGLLVPPGDPDALAAAVDRLLDDRGLAARLGAAGRSRAAAFADGRMVEATEALYREIVSAPAGPAATAG